MSTVSQVFIPSPATDLTKVLSVPETTKQVDRVQAIEVVMYAEQIIDDPATRRAEIAALRMNRLLKLRKGFGIVTATFLILLGVSVALHFPYEPAAALFACTMGTFLVFVMKVKDGRR